MKAFYLPACALLLLGCNEPREQDSTPAKQDSNSTTPTEDPSPAAEEQDPKTISFTKVKRAPGDVRHDTERRAMNMKFTVVVGENPPQEMEMRQTENQSSELTVLETTSGSISKVQLKVIEKESTQKTQCGSTAQHRKRDHFRLRIVTTS